MRNVTCFHSIDMLSTYRYLPLNYGWNSLYRQDRKLLYIIISPVLFKSSYTLFLLPTLNHCFLKPNNFELTDLETFVVGIASAALDLHRGPNCQE